MRVIGYSRVSTTDQADDGYGLSAQQHRIENECAARDWTLLGHSTDVGSGKNLRRPSLETSLEALKGQNADALMVARLDRLSRSVGDFAVLLERAQREKWELVVLDPMVDTSTPYGRAMAQMSAVFAQLERELISQRTREGLERAMAQGKKVGRPRMVTQEAVDLICRLKLEEKLGARRIAPVLDERGIPSPLGGKWSPKTITAVLARELG